MKRKDMIRKRELNPRRSLPVRIHDHPIVLNKNMMTEEKTQEDCMRTTKWEACRWGVMKHITT